MFKLVMALHCMSDKLPISPQHCCKASLASVSLFRNTSHILSGGINYRTKCCHENIGKWDLKDQKNIGTYLWVCIYITHLSPYSDPARTSLLIQQLSTSFKNHWRSAPVFLLEPKYIFYLLIFFTFIISSMFTQNNINLFQTDPGLNILKLISTDTWAWMGTKAPM